MHSKLIFSLCSSAVHTNRLLVQYESYATGVPKNYQSIYNQDHWISFGTACPIKHTPSQLRARENCTVIESEIVHTTEHEDRRTRAVSNKTPWDIEFCNIECCPQGRQCVLWKAAHWKVIWLLVYDEGESNPSRNIVCSQETGNIRGNEFMLTPIIMYR